MKTNCSNRALCGLLAAAAIALALRAQTAGWGLPEPVPVQAGDVPAAFSKAVPASVADFKSMEKLVRALVTRLSPAVVAVEIGSTVGSGVVVSADGLVLSAGHVCERTNRAVVFTFPDGATARGKTVEVDTENDVGLMRITDPGPWPHVAVGDLKGTRAGDWVLALGNPGGFDLRRSLVVRLGRIIGFDREVMQTDCTISGGDSGGPLFDIHGRVIAIHSAISRSVAENFHIPITAFFDEGNGTAAAQDVSLPHLPRTRFTSGEETLQALAPVSVATRDGIVKLDVNEETVALGVVMDTNGWALTKASEIKPGKLTAWLASDREVAAEVLGRDEEADVALVRVRDTGLKPIQWTTEQAAIGQWVVTPGICQTPHSLGIVSALSRRIRGRRAFIGVQFDWRSPLPKIRELLAGLGAEQAGLKPGDLIVGVNHSAVTNREQVVDILRDFGAGQTVTLSVERAGQELDKDVRLMELSPELVRRGVFPESGAGRMAGPVSRRAEGFERVIEHDTVLAPWLCGGPLVNLEGKAVGMNIARADRVTTYALPARVVSRIFDELKAQAERAEGFVPLRPPPSAVQPGF